MMQITPILLQLCPTSIPSSISGFLCSPLTGWFPLVFIGVIAIMIALAMIYQLTPLMGRTDLRNWARLKMYETLVALLLILVFLFISNLLFTINPVPALTVLGIVPNVPSGIDCHTATNLFQLSECELYGFNQAIINSVNVLIFVPQLVYTYIPSVSFGLDLGKVLGLGNDTLAFSDSISINGIGTITSFFTTLLKGFNTFIILADVQLVILNSAMFIFAIFLVVGLIARIFGVTKTFGGAMIAFAIGLGFVLPLMICITYGFMDQALNIINPFTFSYNTMLNWGEAVLQFFISMSTLNLSGAIAGLFGPIIEIIGVALVGILVIPLINFVVVDTFILDFSQALGERMDFLSLLTSIV